MRDYGIGGGRAYETAKNLLRSKHDCFHVAKVRQTESRVFLYEESCVKYRLHMDFIKVVYSNKLGDGN